VNIKGTVTATGNRAVGDAIFTLPVALRPAGKRVFSCVAWTGAATKVIWVDVTSAGVVKLSGDAIASGGFIWLEVSFGV
jgi:hypothetical protein